MSDDPQIPILVILLLIFSIFFGFFLGIEYHEKECVKVGVAEYYINKEFKKQFRFKEIKWKMQFHI